MKKTGLAILVLGVLLIGCSKQEQEQTPATESSEASNYAAEQAKPEVEQTGQMAAQGIPSVSGDTVTTESGLKYIDVTVGDGAMPQKGQLIAAHYTGWLTDGTKFDSSHDRGQPIQFPIGQGRVIRGWDEGLSTMHVGGRRILIIPPDLGYGDRGTPGGPIPPGATLIFDVELVDIPATTTPTP